MSKNGHFMADLVIFLDTELQIFVKRHRNMLKSCPLDCTFFSNILKCGKKNQLSHVQDVDTVTLKLGQTLKNVHFWPFLPFLAVFDYFSFLGEKSTYGAHFSVGYV